MSSLKQKTDHVVQENTRCGLSFDVFFFFCSQQTLWFVNVLVVLLFFFVLFCFVCFVLFFLTRLHEELRRSIEAQMDVMRQGEGSGVEKEVMENMRHQLQLLSQVIISPAMVVFYRDQVMH